MITNEKALGYVLIFVFFMVFSKFSCRPIWILACVSSGKTPAARRIYRKEIRKSENPPKSLYQWLITSSDNPTRTRRLLIKYFLCKLPAFVSLVIAVIGLRTHVFDKLLDISAFVVFFFYAVIFISGLFVAKRI